MTRRRAAAALLATCLACLACGGASTNTAQKSAKAATPKSMRIVREVGRPALAIVTREGDPAGVVAAFVSTSGIGAQRGAVVPVALAGLLASRLEGARVTPQADGVRVVVTAQGDGALSRIAAAMTEPVTDKTDLTLAKRKVAALSALPHLGPDAAAIATCEGAIVPPADASAPSPADVEAWRAAAVVNERVAFGSVGALSQTATKTPALPAGSFPNARAAAAELALVDAVGEVPNGTALVSIAWRGDLRLLRAARALGDRGAPIPALLAASESGAHLRAVSAALSADGACLSLRAQLGADVTTSAGAQRAAQTIALLTREARAAIAEEADAAPSPDDASEAAEQAAMIALASGRDVRTDDAPRVVVAAPNATPQTRDALAHAVDDATRAWSAPIVEARTHVESGQPSTWILLASPCGTAGEGDADAGASAAFAFAAANAARARGVAAAPWIAGDGVGVLASGADAMALADALARSLLVDPVEGGRAAQGRLLDGARAGLAGLAEAVAPGRPASVLPTGTPYALLRLSEPAIIARADSLRRGPLRVAVLSNLDAAGATNAAARVDRWVLREGARACPAQSSAAPPKPGTYAVQTDDGTSEAYVAALVPQASEDEARAIAGALDGDGGLLARSLGDGLAREISARVLGPPGGRALVVHVEAPQAALDAAVIQIRALFDRVRQGALEAADLARAKKHAEDERAARMRDPRERLIALFRDSPAPPDVTLDRARAAAAAFLRDDSLVIVASRPRTRRTP